MHTDPIIPLFVFIALAIVIISAVMKYFKQPAVVAYLLVGFLLGPSVFSFIKQPDILNRLGSLGVLLLLFFVGMEVSPKQLLSNWYVSVAGTLLKVLLSFFVSLMLAHFFNWTFSRVVLITFIISLSSTAVILKLLQDWKELETKLGQNILGILLLQDLLVIPMLIILGQLGGQTLEIHSVILQVIGGSLSIATVVWITVKPEIKLPFLAHFTSDPENQVFIALIICFGLALVTTLCQLSGALGAFLAGMIIASAKQTHWAYQSLNSLRTIFMALFFLSVGMLVDIHFLWQNFAQVIMLVILIISLNTLSTMLILRLLKSSWRESIYGGSLLSQIGEFAFVLASIGLAINIVNKSQYQMLIITITLSLFVSPLWILLIKKLINRDDLILQRLYFKRKKPTNDK
jgi:CPA2 family monovalent cation:H+ antiporter-2